ncbi:M56 family metallopeptidase [Winogradskyella sp. PC D3.3]
METYLLKFSVCLVILWLVYVLFLERQNMHHFKRFYLLGALTLALIIPKLTITEYVEPTVSTFETATTFINIEPAFIEIPEEPSFFDLETTLWFIYGIGALLFALRFLNNLFQMQRRISKNVTIKNRSFIYVLLQENLIPHSFFRYIFFNKTRYESNHIPKEVVLHEETHAKQLHSLDIIILELLQIAFWFHPLIYILKHHVKLNHEFLADQAVLQQGSDAKTYQTILLQFSSNTQNHHLSSAINYSSIKKRFTVMKTQTSKTRIWLSTLLVLPIIAVLFYNFAEKEYIEIEPNESSQIQYEPDENVKKMD